MLLKTNYQNVTVFHEKKSRKYENVSTCTGHNAYVDKETYFTDEPTATRTNSIQAREAKSIKVDVPNVDVTPEPLVMYNDFVSVSIFG